MRQYKTSSKVTDTKQIVLSHLPFEAGVDVEIMVYPVGDKNRREISAAMLASEAVLQREWDTPEENEAWADL